MRLWTVVIWFSSMMILIVLPFNGSADETVSVSGIPENGRLVNPLNATVNHDDPANITVTWFLDGEVVHEGENIQRFIFPGIHNLTVRIRYNDGNETFLYFGLDPVPPPGWGEGPDQKRNDLIFWTIFGTGGLVFAATAGWIWLRKDRNGKKEPLNETPTRIRENMDDT